MGEGAVEKYAAAIRSLAEYAPKLSAQEMEENSPERGYLRAMAEEVAQADRTVIAESRSYVRSILREYRDESARYLADVRSDLQATAGTLRDISGTLAASESEGGVRLEAAVEDMRGLTREPACRAAATLLRDAIADLERGVGDMRKHYQLTISQFHTEIRLLYRRMEALTAASLDDLSELMPRDELEDRIAVAAPGTFRIVVLKPKGLIAAKSSHPAPVFRDLSVAFTRRMRNNLPGDSPVGRWSDETFVALVFAGLVHVRELAATLHRRLSGPYICRDGAHTVMVPLETTVQVLDTSSREGRDAVLQAIDMAL